MVMEIGAFSISLAHTGSMPQRTAASGNTPIPSNRLPSRSAVILSAPLSLDGQNALKGGGGNPEPLGNGDVVLHVLVVCGHTVTEAMKNDIAVAQRLGITATTLEGILTVKGQGRR